MSAAIQISDGKDLIEKRHIDHIVRLPSNTPFGNLCLSKMAIESRIGYINIKLVSICAPFPLKLNAGIVPDFLPQLIDIPTEEVVYLIRRSTDDLICLWALLSHFTEKGCYPTRIKCDHVGAFCEEIKKYGDTHEFADHQNWLQTLNEVSNAYKHSIMQRQLQVLSTREPTVLVMIFKRNDSSNPHDFKRMSLAELVAGFEKFYQCVNLWLFNWARANPDCHQSKLYNL